MPDFKKLLEEHSAKWLGQSGRELAEQTEIKRWFPAPIRIQERHACIAYLNTKTSYLNDAQEAQSYVTNPMVDGVELEGRWRLVWAGMEEDRTGVVQVLRKGFITTLGTGGTVDWSEFYILN